MTLARFRSFAAALVGAALRRCCTGRGECCNACIALGCRCCHRCKIDADSNLTFLPSFHVVDMLHSGSGKLGLHLGASWGIFPSGDSLARLRRHELALGSFTSSRCAVDGAHYGCYNASVPLGLLLLLGLARAVANAAMQAQDVAIN